MLFADASDHIVKRCVYSQGEVLGALRCLKKKIKNKKQRDTKIKNLETEEVHIYRYVRYKIK
jgi:hypothetical protein